MHKTGKSLRSSLKFQENITRHSYMLARNFINVDSGFLENLMVLESLSCGGPAALAFLLVILLDLSTSLAQHWNAWAGF